MRLDNLSVQEHKFLLEFWIQNNFSTSPIFRQTSPTSLHGPRLAYENLKFLFLQFIENFQPWHLAKEFFSGTPKKWRTGGGKKFIWKSRFSGSKIYVVDFFDLRFGILRKK